MNDPVLIGLLSAVVLALAVTVIALILLARRRDVGEDVRELVVSLENLRSGKPARKPELADGSQLSLLADAVHRLGQDLAHRSLETEDMAARLAALTEADFDSALVATDDEGVIRVFSNAATDLFGWRQDEVLGCQFTILFEDDSWKELMPRMARREVREKGLRYQGRMLRKDRTPFDADLSIRMVSRLEGGRGGYLAVLRDITEQLAYQRRLAASEERYRRLVEDIGEGVVILREGRIRFANDAMADLAGLGVEELVGEPLLGFVATPDLLLVKEGLALLETGERGREEIHFTLAAPEGGVGPRVRLRGAAIEYEGEPAVLALVTDETLERRVEAELRRNELRLDAVLEATSDGVVVLVDTRDGGMVHLTNRSFLELFGLERRDVLGVSIAALRRLLGDRGRGAEAVGEFVASAGRTACQDTTVLDGDPPRQLELNAAPLADHDGALLGTILTCRDMSIQKESEERLRERGRGLSEELESLREQYVELQALRDELKGRIEEMVGEIDDLKKLGKMKSNFLSNVAHDLQTPLVSIRGYTEMIHRDRLGDVNEEQRKALELCLRNIDRLVSMIESLAVVSQMDDDLAELELRTFSLRELLEECAESLRPNMEARRIECTLDLKEPGIRVHGDREKIRQVLDNLLTNAVKYNREGGSIEVQVRAKSSEFALVEVRDTGVGIPRDDQDRIFERHYRVQSAMEAGTRGRGLGLSIVKHILQLHGCTIKVESEQGKGSNFSFTLPLAREGEETSEAPAESAIPEPEARREDEAHEPEPEPGGKPRLKIIRRN